MREPSGEVGDLVVDREQVRRDDWKQDYWRDRALQAEAHASDLRIALGQAERENWALKEELGSPDDPESWVSLKARLAEAERERDRLKKWQRAYSRGRAGLVSSADQDFERAEAAEARLAAVPALVEALTRIEHWMFSVMRDDVSDVTAIKEVAGAALAAYEAAQ